MSRYNRFGKIYTDVMALYPGTVVTDYDGGGANGQLQIEGALDRAVFEVAASISPAVYKAITLVDAQEIVNFATAGQTSFTLGLAPVVAGSVHLWIYPLLPAPGSRWVTTTIANDWYLPPAKGYLEVATSDYAVTASTGVIAYSGRALLAGEHVYASYQVDTDNASFSIPMLGQVAMLGAAAELGERLYSASTQEWALVTQYRARFDDLKSKLKTDDIIPDEIRAMSYYKDIEQTSGEVKSVRLYRG